MNYCYCGKDSLSSSSTYPWNERGLESNFSMSVRIQVIHINFTSTQARRILVSRLKTRYPQKLRISQPQTKLWFSWWAACWTRDISCLWTTGSRLYLYMMGKKTVLWHYEGESGSNGSPTASGQPARANESSAFWPSSLCQMAKQQGGVYAFHHAHWSHAASDKERGSESLNPAVLFPTILRWGL